MKKKIISLILIAMVSSTALISCGKTNTISDANQNSNKTEQTSDSTNSTNEETGNSSIIGENNKPTVEVKQVATIADFKDKDANTIQKFLGNPISENGNTSTYEKDDYKFEITYFDSKCGKIRITPKVDMKYPADGTNILKVLGINAGNADQTSPAGLEWNNKFDTYKINVVSNNEPDGKIEYAEIILAEAYNN